MAARPDRETAALTQEPDATEERVVEILRAARLEYRKAVTNRRIVARDVLYPPPPDPDGRY